MKKTKALTFFIFSIFLFIPFSVRAQEIEVSTDTLLKAYLSTGGEIKLTADITLTANTPVNEDKILNLNGHSLNMSNKTLIPYAKLTIKDTSSEQTGKITGSGTYVIQVGTSSNEGNLILESGTIDCSNKTYCISIPSKGKLILNGGKVTAINFPIVNTGIVNIDGSIIEASDGSGIYGNTNSTTTLNNGTIKVYKTGQAVTLAKPGSKFVMNGGKIDASYFSNKGGVGILGFKDTETIINDGTITTGEACIMGNGSESGNNAGTNAKFTINGGTITSTNALAIYAPQVNGETLITGGTITGATSAIEIRAGKLTITGGTLNGNKNNYQIDPNSNGSNTIGAAISIVQHTTKQPIEVNISGGTFNASVPVSEANTMNNSAEDVAKISLNISNGIFSSSSDNTLDLEDISGDIITGGTYTHDVKEYLDEEKYGQKDNNDSYIVLPFRNVTVNESTNQGFVNENKSLPREEVTITPEVKEDYKISEIIIKDKDGNIIEVNDNKFIMPDSDVSISIKYTMIYKIISGNKQLFKLTDSNDIEIKSNGELSKLTGIKVDGTLIDSSNYKTASGSTILILKNEYLKKLSVGTHTISFVYDDGSVDATLIVADDKTNNISNPKTGDNIVRYFLIFVLSIGSIFLFKRKLYKV